jgi:hypothetical protein
MSHYLEATTPIPNGVVFLCDPTAIIDVPPDTAEAPVLSTKDCISLWTLHEVDGPTTLVLTDAYKGEDCKLVFHGSIILTGRKLGFNTSSCERIIEVDLGADMAEVAVYANDAKDPSKLICVAAPLRPKS